MKKTPRAHCTALSESTTFAGVTTSSIAAPDCVPPVSRGPEKIPPHWAWHYRTLLGLRGPLLRAHLEHASEVAAPTESGGIDASDVVQDRRDRDLLWAELAAEDDRLYEVDCALQRIRDGVYGFCEETGNPIPADRLRAIPWTRFCRAAAERREVRKRTLPANRERRHVLR